MVKLGKLEKFLKKNGIYYIFGGRVNSFEELKYYINYYQRETLIYLKKRKDGSYYVRFYVPCKSKKAK